MANLFARLDFLGKLEMANANFKVHSQVKAVKGGNSSLTFVGYKAGGLTPKMDYQVGVYGFSNPITATMYAYLKEHSDVDQAVAITCASSLEEKLSDIGGLSSVAAITPLDVLTTVVPQTKLLKVADKILSIGGEAMDKLRQSSKPEVARKNPYTPNGKLYWSGWGHNLYVDYALGFWKKYPSWGPAYEIGVIL